MSAEPEFPPVDRTAPQLTIRAIATGMVLGGVLSLTNIYSGLKIGWGFNMSVTAAVLAYGFWQPMHRFAKAKHWGILESNINQTAASSAASISSAGLVAPIPALTMITGHQFTWHVLVAWTFVITLVGIVVAVGLRRQMLIVDRLPFPNGIATAETLKEMYAQGAEAMARFKMLLFGAGLAAVLKLIIEYAKVPTPGLPGSFAATGAAKAKGIGTISMKNLTFALDPSPLMVAVGAIIGLRAGASMLIGAVIGWGVLTPYVLDLGWADPGAADPDKSWFGPVLKWLLWPGVAMMVTASLTSFAFSWRSVLAAMSGTRSAAKGEASVDEADEVPRRWFLYGLLVVLVLAVIAQVGFFDIAITIAAVGVLFTFLLAIVAGRVAGETGITPVGAMGKVTQLLFGVLAPGNPTANLMAANVTGGAASQCADLLHDMKTGLMIGSSPRLQTIAQVFGALAGALCGSAAYLVIVPDAESQLLTSEWPAPAVAAWKAVAEIFQSGLDAMPPAAVEAIAIAGVAGIVLAILEKTVPRRARPWVPSPAAMGLAFVIPAYYSISMFLGGLAGWVAMRYATRWSERFLIVLASGIIAGEGITGVAVAIQKILFP